jgi:hypothetical protein
MGLAWAKSPDNFVAFEHKQHSKVERELFAHRPYLHSMLMHTAKATLQSKQPGTAPEQMRADLMASSLPWAFDCGAESYALVRGAFPVHVWAGAQDDITPHSAHMHGLWSSQASAGRAAHLHVREGFKHSLVWFFFEDILDAALPAPQPGGPAAQELLQQQQQQQQQPMQVSQ